MKDTRTRKIEWVLTREAVGPTLDRSTLTLRFYNAPEEIIREVTELVDPDATDYDIARMLFGMLGK